MNQRYSNEKLQTTHYRSTMPANRCHVACTNRCVPLKHQNENIEIHIQTWQIRGKLAFEVIGNVRRG